MRLGRSAARLGDVPDLGLLPAATLYTKQSYKQLAQTQHTPSP
jgi:hypothetical protein